MRAAAAVTFLLSSVASISAYSVLTPNAQVGWTNQGPQNITWSRVSTDPLNFTVVLDNQSIQGFQMQVLAALVNGTSGFTTVNSHNGGWPTGSNFRVNFVQDPEDLNTILAQSNDFNITDVSNASSTSNGGFPTTVTTGTGIDTSTPTGTQSDTSGASSTTAVIPANGATSYSIQTGLLALFPLIGFALA